MSASTQLFTLLTPVTTEDSFIGHVVSSLGIPFYTHCNYWLDGFNSLQQEVITWNNMVCICSCALTAVGVIINVPLRIVVLKVSQLIYDIAGWFSLPSTQLWI